MDGKLQLSERNQLSTQPTASLRDYTAWVTMELGRIAILLGENPSEERLTLTVSEITDIPRDLLVKAFAEIRRNGRYFPKPVEIREIAYRNPIDRMTFANGGTK
jgi:hypothetical protein